MSDADARLLEPLLAELAERIARRVAELTPTAAAEEASPWMGIERAAAYLDWPRQRLYKLTAAGAIPHYKQDRRLLFRRDELDRWLGGFAEGERP